MILKSDRRPLFRQWQQTILTDMRPTNPNESPWDEHLLLKFMSLKDLWRMSLSATLIPKAQSANDHLVDIGGTVFWLPLYLTLGYRRITVVVRPGAGGFYGFEVLRAEQYQLNIVEADAELDQYPIAPEDASCITCFELLEHFAGDPMHCIAESNRILAKDGVICLTTPNVLWHQNLVNLFIGDHPFSWSVYTATYADRHNREYTPFEVTRLLNEGGFNVEHLTTANYQNQSYKRKGLGHLLSLPSALTGRVSLALRGEVSFVRARKAGSVKSRYPEFLYNLYGLSRVTSYKDITCDEDSTGRRRKREHCSPFK